MAGGFEVSARTKSGARDVRPVHRLHPAMSAHPAIRRSFGIQVDDLRTRFDFDPQRRGCRGQVAFGHPAP